MADRSAQNAPPAAHSLLERVVLDELSALPVEGPLDVNDIAKRLRLVLPAEVSGDEIAAEIVRQATIIGRPISGAEAANYCRSNALPARLNFRRAISMSTSSNPPCQLLMCPSNSGDAFMYRNTL